MDDYERIHLVKAEGRAGLITLRYVIGDVIETNDMVPSEDREDISHNVTCVCVCVSLLPFLFSLSLPPFLLLPSSPSLFIRGRKSATDYGIAAECSLSVCVSVLTIKIY